MASKAFANAVKKKSSQLEKSRKVKPGGFSLPDIDDGDYVFLIGAKSAVRGEDDAPVVTFRCTVSRGPFRGVSINKDIWLANADEEREQKNWDELSKCIQVLGYDMDEIEPEDIPEVLEEVDSDKPLIRGGLKNWTSKAGNQGITIYFNELLEADDAEDEGQTQEAEEDSDEAAETPSEIEEGMKVRYKRKTYLVETNDDGDFVLFHEKTDITLEDVDWDSVQILDD